MQVNAAREVLLRCADLVFIQNGMLYHWLERRGLEECTQALVYFAVAKFGEKPTDGTTDANPEGLTAVCGKHAEEFAERLHKAGLTCHVLDKTAFRQAMVEKLVWIWCAPVVTLIFQRWPLRPTTQRHACTRSDLVLTARHLRMGSHKH